MRMAKCTKSPVPIVKSDSTASMQQWQQNRELLQRTTNREAGGYKSFFSFCTVAPAIQVGPPACESYCILLFAIKCFAFCQKNPTLPLRAFYCKCKHMSPQLTSMLQLVEFWYPGVTSTTSRKDHVCKPSAGLRTGCSPHYLPFPIIRSQHTCSREMQLSTKHNPMSNPIHIGKFRVQHSAE